MPKVQFHEKEEVIQWWCCEVEVPQEIIDEGQEAVEKWVREEGQEPSSNLDYIEMVHSDTKESFIEVDEIVIK